MKKEKNKCDCTYCNNKLNEFCIVKVQGELFHKTCGIKKAISLLGVKK